MEIELKGFTKPEQQGKLVKMKVDYVRDGKATTRTLVNIGKTRDVMKFIAGECASGDVLEIGLEKSEKDGQTFSNWVSAAKVNAQAASAVKSNTGTVRSTYETPEERARKQVYIVRQSSITSAIEYLQHQGKKFSTDDVLEVAGQFTDYVFRGFDEFVPANRTDLVDPEESLARAAALAEKGQKEFEDDIPF